MGHRYCDDCARWLSTAEYTVDESGETICPKDDHGPVQGFVIDGTISHAPGPIARSRAKKQGIVH